MSANAGKVFGDNITFLDEDSDMSLSLICHSMGGRTLLYFAKQLPMFPTQPFDHLFFVAADVWDEAFNERVINNRCSFDLSFPQKFPNISFRRIGQEEMNGRQLVSNFVEL